MFVEALSKVGVGIIGLIVASQCGHYVHSLAIADSNDALSSSGSTAEMNGVGCSSSAGSLCAWAFDASIILTVQGLCYLLFSVGSRTLIHYEHRCVFYSFSLSLSLSLAR
mmetsp:Transcript_2444/g.7768  ORF Transcript_2444/g.7768 Transcript_2444/m.7768 type:complete len:110 (-) Transcript_2444:62-391(-)